MMSIFRKNGNNRFIKILCNNDFLGGSYPKYFFGVNYH